MKTLKEVVYWTVILFFVMLTLWCITTGDHDLIPEWILARPRSQTIIL